MMHGRRVFRLLVVTALAGASWIAVPACDGSIDLGSSGDAAAGVESGPGVDGSTPTDAPATPITCDDVCKKVQACGFLEPGKYGACLSDCSRATQADLSCVMAAQCNAIQSCAQLPDASTDGPTPIDVFEIQQCQQACDHVEFFDCIDASTHAACRALCETAPRTKRNSFESCGNSGSNCPKLQDCVQVFLGG